MFPQWRVLVAMECSTDEKHTSVKTFRLVPVDYRAVKTRSDYVMVSLAAFRLHDWTGKKIGICLFLDLYLRTAE